MSFHYSKLILILIQNHAANLNIIRDSGWNSGNSSWHLIKRLKDLQF